MTIPVFRHNHVHDDWEVASVYFSDDASFGRSVYDEPVRATRSFDDPVLRSRGQLYEGIRPHGRYSVPQQQPQNHPPVASAHPRWDARYMPGKQSNFVIPPPGVIFPSKEWVPPPQDPYRSRPPGQIASSPERLLDATLAEPPPSSLLLSPSSPPRASASLNKLPIPQTTIGHGQSHGTTTVAGAGPNANGYVSPLMGPPPRYHDMASSTPPRLADAGCHQAHSGMNPRRTGYDVLPSYAPGHAGMLLRDRPSLEEMDGRRGNGGYGPGDGPERVHEQEYGYDSTVGRGRVAETRERRPSLWRRFVKRFGPSRGQT